MGQFVNTKVMNNIVWNKIVIPYYTGNNEEYTDDEDVIVLEIPSGKIIEIYTSGKGDFKFSSDSRSEGNKDSQVGKYLEKYIYEKLDIISESLFSIPTHFYGFINKKGFQGIDININSNFLDWELSKDLFTKANIKVPVEIYSGLFSDIELNILDSFIIRSYFEYPDNRSIFYKRKKA